MTDNILSLIGNTPLLKLKNIGGGRICAKAEFLNPGGSIKDRVANHIIGDAVKRGILKEGMTIVEATSGNTGIAVSFVGRLMGFKVIICMPEDMSEERKKIIRVLGAELVETPKEKSIAGSVEAQEKITAELGDKAFTVGQFVNKLNPEIHYLTTGREIWEQSGGVDAFVAGIGSGGTLTGCGRYIKEMNPKAKIVAVEPKNSAALLGHEPGFHQIQGIGDGFIPAVLDVDLIDEVITVSDEDAIAMTRNLAATEGTLVGTSSGANVWAAVKVAEELGSDALIATVMPDRAERYFSTSLL
ncbi:MAG: cysteine synthase A [Abditibacteriota bacterium]|nr:cysteine synthase A [Abditibacteriota bacterium]MBP5738475.1 cysteine synthase A [Abditibacteriota bacterium]